MSDFGDGTKNRSLNHHASILEPLEALPGHFKSSISSLVIPPP